ncbi:MAG TPA: hypothetical protein VF412_01095 [Bdellovibrio sp.]|uniref:hypothetical protein n=1 Tax=Bdellovibrio sp. TaxID=28201 RepID=UPI002EF24F04
MKHLFEQTLRRITAAIAVVAALTACSSNPDSANVSGDVKVLAPMNDDKAASHYSLQFIELLGLNNLQEVSGKFVHFFFSPRIVNNHLDGVAPKGRFIRNTNGNYVPANDLSQQMTVIYAHMQRLAQMDVDLGAEGINQWPRDVGVGVRVTGGMDNNAFYDGKTDSMLFVPYTQADLPIAVNGGILAHEHFHSLFYKIVLKGLAEDATVHDREFFLKNAGIEEIDTKDDSKSGETKTEPKESNRIVDMTRPQLIATDDDIHAAYQKTLLRGINEGMADFWGWVYTGNPDFIASSLPSEKSARSLSVSGTRGLDWLPTELSVKRSVSTYMTYDLNQTQYLTGYAYTVGTQYSRVMKGFADLIASNRGLDSLTARRQVAKWLLASLATLRSDVEKSSDGSYYNPGNFVQGFVGAIPDLQEKECNYWMAVMNNSISSSDKKQTCKQDGSWKLVPAE